jgi:hypothetical protein
MNTLNKKLANAHQKLVDAYNAEAGALNTTIANLSNFKSSLHDFDRSLYQSGASGLDPISQYATSKAIFEQDAKLAAQGNKGAQGRLQGDEEAFLSASQAAAKTSAQYQKDLALVRSANEKAEKNATKQIDTAKEQLKALNQSVKGLDILANRVLSVKDAIDRVKDIDREIARLNRSVTGDHVRGGSVESMVKALRDYADAQKAYNRENKEYHKSEQKSVDRQTDTAKASTKAIVKAAKEQIKTNEALTKELIALRAELKNVTKNTLDTSKVLRAVTQGGNVLKVATA